MQTIKIWSRGADVVTAQKALGVQPDGIFGPLTLEAVKDFQLEHKLEVDGIVGPKTWAALLSGDVSGASEPAELPKLKKSKRTIKRLIVHCTATREGQEVSVEQIRKWHTDPENAGGRGWSDIGYHYVIYLDGSIHLGRDVDISGAHTAGYNSTSIGICYVGGLDASGKAKDTRTSEQKASLVNLLKRLKALYPSSTIHGHCEFAAKACPCFDAKSEYKGL